MGKKDEIINNLKQQLEQLKATKVRIEELEMIKDTKVTPPTSVPLAVSTPTSDISRFNMPKSEQIVIPQSIDINEPQTIKSSLSEPDRLIHGKIESVPLSVAEQTSLLSKRNRPKLPSYIQPKSINANISKTPSFSIFSSPQQRTLDVADEASDLLPKK